MDGSLRVLDRMFCCETHKVLFSIIFYCEGILDRASGLSYAVHLKQLSCVMCYSCQISVQVGVLYVGPGQENDEKAIFSNQFGSIRYR